MNNIQAVAFPGPQVMSDAEIDQVSGGALPAGVLVGAAWVAGGLVAVAGVGVVVGLGVAYYMYNYA